MGSLVIKKVEYHGKKYYFESPEFSTGINIIKGDNGSGKTTLSFFIEFGLGENIEVFKKFDATKKVTPSNTKEEYKHITEDINNYVLLTIEINKIPFKFKRFIGTNDIFIEFQNGEVKQFCLNRQHCKLEVFSDWLLSQLDIKIFELNLGTRPWFFKFNDLFRLMYYDQDTEVRKIYKKPNSENFVTDSAVIRKSIFETLMGNSSDEYFLKMNELNDSNLKKKEAKILLDEFNKINPDLNLTFKDIEVEKDTCIEQLHKLIESRKSYQKENTKVYDKFKQLEDKKRELIALQIEESHNKIQKNNIEIEKNKIEKLLQEQKYEIESIEKTIFTQEKLNLFDFKICPFCASDVVKEDKKCICGATIKENNYEKFLYDSSEYKDILQHKNKTLETIESALKSYDEEIIMLENDLDSTQKEIHKINEFLKEAIKSIEYSGNSEITDEIDNKISEVKNKVFKLEKLEDLYKQKEKYKSNFDSKSLDYTTKDKEFKDLEDKYKKEHYSIIKNFNTLYNTLMTSSSAKTKRAQIDDDYMPIIDNGVYREKSATVPIRMMYFFALLSMALKYPAIKHPKFLLMDTPEDAGIDTNNLTENILLFNKALELSKNSPNETIQDYQFILTTGLEKCPQEYNRYVKLDFNKEEGRFILQEKLK